MEIIYKNTIKDLGKNANALLKENMLVFFGYEAPNDLKDFCYIIETLPVEKEIKAGQSLIIDNIKFNITSVGSAVKQNLENIGHITIKFNGNTTPDLPGTLYLEEKGIPVLDIGTKIEIVAN